MRILNYKLADDGKHVAFFDLEVSDDVTYPNLRIMPSKDGKGHWVALPGFVKGEDRQGKKIWGSYPTLSPDYWDELRKKIHSLLKEVLDHPTTNSPYQDTPF